MTTPVVALTISGSDSGGGAGMQADLKTFAALGVFGTSAITAVTAQNTTAVRSVYAIPTEVVVAQILAVLDDLEVRAVKTGMLVNSEIIGAVAALAAEGRLPNLVVDPVMVSSTGDRLLRADAERSYTEELLPLARVVTPNLWEAGVLIGRELRTLADQRDAAVELVKAGPEVVVVKGGHAVEDAHDTAVDVVATRDGEMRELRASRIATMNNHGSGCSLASAIAVELARGAEPLGAIAQAKDFVHRSITGGAGWQIGEGHGPLDHFNWEEVQ